MFYNRVTNVFGLSLQDLRKEFPEISIGEGTVEHQDYVRYDEVEPPAFIEGQQHLVEATPVLFFGTWKQRWQVVDFTAEELAATQVELQNAVHDEVRTRVQEILDGFAQTRGYDNIVSACSYAVSKKPRNKAEGEYCVDLRDTYWDICNGVMNDVLAGNRPMPTADEVIAELPAPEWPADPI
jgi:hypothetical protein